MFIRVDRINCRSEIKPDDSYRLSFVQIAVEVIAYGCNGLTLADPLYTVVIIRDDDSCAAAVLPLPSLSMATPVAISNSYLGYSVLGVTSNV